MPRKLSFLGRAADPGTPALDPIEPAPCREDDSSDSPDAEPAVPVPAFERRRTEGNATFCIRGLLPPTVGNEVVRELTGGGMTKRSAADAEGGERGRDVRIGRLPGDVDSESRCWFLTNVGVKSCPSSDRNLDDNKDSSASISKYGFDRYVTESERLPVGCAMGAKVCVSFVSGEAPRAGGASMYRC